MYNNKRPFAKWFMFVTNNSEPDAVCEIVWWNGMINSVLLPKEQSDLGLHLLFWLKFRINTILDRQSTFGTWLNFQTAWNNNSKCWLFK